MALSVDELPDDVESLKALLLAAHAASEAAEIKSASLIAEVDRLTAERTKARRANRGYISARLLILASYVCLLGFIFKEPIGVFAFEQTIVRNYIATQVRPYVLKEEAESALKVGTTFRECAKNCPEMVVVPAGSFQMGSPDNEPGRYKDESPMRTVNISKPFAVGRFTVTWDEWETCVSMRGCDGTPTNDATFGKGRKPVINVSWDQARTYVNWLSRMTGKPYRLLTEAEWEFAARAGTKAAYYFGDETAEICKYANLADQSHTRRGYTTESVDCDDGHVQTAPVGSYPPNPFGLYDMAGNVFQWVEDCYAGSYKDAPLDGSAPRPKEGCSHVLRGGSWISRPRYLRSARRYIVQPGNRFSTIGFRVARTLPLGR